MSTSFSYIAMNAGWWKLDAGKKTVTRLYYKFMPGQC